MNEEKNNAYVAQNPTGGGAGTKPGLGSGAEHEYSSTPEAGNSSGHTGSGNCNSLPCSRNACADNEQSEPSNDETGKDDSSETDEDHSGGDQNDDDSCSVCVRV